VDTLSYSYDSFGNLGSQTRTADSASNTETYGYDKLQRLTTATRSVGGAAVSYGYSDNGNLTSKSDFASLYNYAAANSRSSGCGPHAAYQVTLTQSGTGTYTCDANGNVYASTVRALQLTYNADNQPRTSTASGGNMSWAYDAYGHMSYETSAMRGNRVFGPHGYEQVVGGAQIHELGPIIVTRQGGTDKVTTALRDRLGSTIDTIDSGLPSFGNTRTYDAFGAVRNGDMTGRGGTLNLGDTIHGFTKHDHADEVQLIHMGGRIYDYNLGRFLSVDPIVASPLSSQSLNPCSYIGNNPLSGTDPTGYVACTGSHIDRGNDAGDCGGQGVSTTWVNPPNGDQRGNGATRQGATSSKNSGSASDVGSSKEPVDHCASGLLTCHKEQYNGDQPPTDLGLVSSHEIDGAGFINGITGDTDRHANLGAKHLSADMSPMPSSFTLIDSPSAGLLGDVAKIGLTQMGVSRSVAKQLAGILLDVQHDAHHLDLVCHSGGCAELKAAIHYAFASTHESLTNIRASFHAGANNMWLTNRILDRAGIARFGGINAPGYRYNPHDMVPQIVGGNALLHPIDIMMSIWNAPKLFSGDEHLSPHTLPYRPDERLP
jgi:RHS repeat-associated protein